MFIWHIGSQNPPLMRIAVSVAATDERITCQWVLLGLLEIYEIRTPQSNIRTI